MTKRADPPPMPPLRLLLDRVTGQQPLSQREILAAAVSAFLAIGLVALASRKFLAGVDLPFIIASMGASAVLIFAVPSSPMNRPWAVAGGHLASAFVGVTCAQHIGPLEYAVPVTVLGAITVMLYLRCLHPPGGATALLMVLGDERVHAAGYHFILTPVALNVALLLAMAVVIRALTRQMRQHSHEGAVLQWLDELEQGRPLGPRLTLEDIKAARARLGTYVDVKDEELLQLLHLATHNTHQRRLGELVCRELMLESPICAEFGSSLEEVWDEFQRHHLTAMPVVDRARRVIGIITLHDFIHHATTFPQETLEERIGALVQPTPQITSDKPEVAGQIMTAPVVTAGVESRVAELLPLLDNRHIHHIPIVDDNNKLVGLLSRSDIVAILERDDK